jgi:hypothetical protein
MEAMTRKGAFMVKLENLPSFYCKHFHFCPRRHTAASDGQPTENKTPASAEPEEAEDERLHRIESRLLIRMPEGNKQEISGIGD